MVPIFEYMNKNKDNKLYFEQFGNLTDNQKFETTLKLLEEGWSVKQKELLLQNEVDRDPNAYFNNLCWTFRKQYLLLLLCRLF
jgi:hypothetical protein